jgi:F-type H+-transporting ATPase subunit delta
MQSASRQSLTLLSEELDARARDTGGDELQPALEQTGDGLFAVANLLDREVGLRRTLSDPSIEGDAKVGIVEGLLSGRVSAGALSVTADAVRLRWSRVGDLPVSLAHIGAQALFTVAQLRGELDGVEDDLFRFARVLEREPELRRALMDAGRPADDRVALLRGVLGVTPDSPGGTSGRVITVRLLESAVRSPRTRSLDAAVDELSRLAAARRQQLVASVRVARPLDEAQAQRLGESLRRLYGRAVTLQVEVDPDVMGGAVVRVGDEVVDGSVARRLEEARRRLAG